MVESIFKLPMEQHLPAGLVLHEKDEWVKLNKKVVFGELLHRKEVTCNRRYVKNILKMKGMRGSWNNSEASVSNAQTCTIFDSHLSSTDIGSHIIQLVVVQSDMMSCSKI